MKTTSPEEFRFNALFHTYTKVADSPRTSVGPLKGLKYIDRMDGMKALTQQSNEVIIEQETANMYDISSENFEVTIKPLDESIKGIRLNSTGFTNAM